MMTDHMHEERSRLSEMRDVAELVMSVKAAHRELARLDNELMRPLGLTGPQADAVLVLDRAGPLSLKALGDLLIAESGHPSRLVDRLVSAGLVQRTAADEDRRRVELALTPAGRTLAGRIAETRAQAMTAATAALGDRDLAPALALMREFLAASPASEVIRRRLDLLVDDA